MTAGASLLEFQKVKLLRLLFSFCIFSAAFSYVGCHVGLSVPAKQELVVRQRSRKRFASYSSYRKNLLVPPVSASNRLLLWLKFFLLDLDARICTRFRQAKNIIGKQISLFIYLHSRRIDSPDADASNYQPSRQ